MLQMRKAARHWDRAASKGVFADAAIPIEIYREKQPDRSLIELHLGAEFLRGWAAGRAT